VRSERAAVVTRQRGEGCFGPRRIRRNKSMNVTVGSVASVEGQLIRALRRLIAWQRQLITFTLEALMGRTRFITCAPLTLVAIQVAAIAMSFKQRWQLRHEQHES
jgi:hypothetical protein